MNALNFHHAARSYVDDYIILDGPCLLALSTNCSLEDRCVALARMAVGYSIARTLHIPVPPESIRLEQAYRLLMSCDSPDDMEAFSNVVDELAEDLGKAYPLQGEVKGADTSTLVLLSAASKFLWMRFQSPVVMYDQLAVFWLKNEGGFRPTRKYGAFRRIWEIQYRKFEPEVRAACEELEGFQKFTLASEMQSNDFKKLLSSDLFAERVFDHAIIKAAADEKTKRSIDKLCLANSKRMNA